jgi:hypothetical protein
MTNLLIKLAILAITATGITGCAKDGDSKSTPAGESKTPVTKAATADKEPAAPDVVPGSHEDWCDEHQVPESQCTRCNPELVAAFKATDDWCDEHGMPESQCTKCNPDLKIARPPKKD